MNPESLALLRGIKTSLLHLMATGPLDALQPVTDAYLAVRRAEAAVPKLGTNLPTGKPGDLDELRRERNHPMHAVALEMAEGAGGGSIHEERTYRIGGHPPRTAAEIVGRHSNEPQTVADEPWEAAP